MNPLILITVNFFDLSQLIIFLLTFQFEVTLQFCAYIIDSQDRICIFNGILHILFEFFYLNNV